VGSRARFAVPNNGAWSELCCVSQWGVVLGLHAVPHSAAQGKVCCV